MKERSDLTSKVWWNRVADLCILLCPVSEKKVVRIHRTIVRIRIGPPEAHGSHVRDAGTELLAQQPEQSEDQVAGVGGIGHDFPWFQVELLLQHSLQQK